MSRNLREDIYQFVSGLPEWQQILSANLLGLTVTELKKEEAIDIALQLLLFDNKLLSIQPKKIELNISLNDAEDDANQSTSYKLISINSVQNLNALNASQTFPIASEGLTVVYGENGVGKSGYGRLFNNAFYSRGDNFLIGNVFGPTKNQPISAIFEIIDNSGTTSKLKYPENKNHPAFKKFSSFDSKSVNVHIDSQNELHVQPRELDFFENLIQMIKLVSDQIDFIVAAKNKENHFFKAFVEDSSIKSEVSALSSNSSLSKLITVAKLSDEDEKNIVELEKQKSSLSLTELEKNKKRLQAIKTKAAGLKVKLVLFESSFGKEKIEFINKAIIRYEDLKAEVARNGVEQFSDLQFKGIGSDLWQQFIKSGKELNSLHLEEHPNYPTNSDSCPYCRQKLTDQAVDLIQKYAAFLESNARDSMKKAHDWGIKYLEGLEAFEVPQISEEEAFGEWAKGKFQLVLNAIIVNLEKIKVAKGATISSIKSWDKSLLQNLELEFVDWVALESALEKEVLDLNEEKVKAQLKKVSDELVILQHKKILGQLISDITLFVNDLKYSEELDKLKKQIGRTTTITNKATELHERYISNKYVQLFKQDCIDLNIPCPDLNPVGAKGKTKRKYSIVGELPSKILSEGEQRAVALADFFTEAQISDMSGLIFDDPVNSQDYKRKAKIAHRLAVESKRRQVVVLTHDLLFLNDLVAAAGDIETKLTCHWMSKNSSTETGIIYANTVPDIEKAFIDGKIAKDRLAEAKIALSPLEAFRASKDGLGALRASYEAFIVRVVFDGIVERFSRRVRQSEVHKVHAPKEALYFITSKLGELSAYITGHLQVDSSTTEITPDLLDKEIGIYEKFSAEFKKEKKEALNLFNTKVDKGEVEFLTFN